MLKVVEGLHFGAYQRDTLPNLSYSSEVIEVERGCYEAVDIVIYLMLVGRKGLNVLE